jgi:hypothetical protein
MRHAVSYIRKMSIVLGFAAVTAAFGLTLGAPRTTHADDFDELAYARVGGALIDGVRVSATIARDAKSKTGWSLVVDAENDDDAPKTCVLQTAIERTWTTPMARVASEVATLMTRQEKLEVPAHGKATLRRDVPAWVVEQLATAEKLQKARSAAMKRATKDANAWSSPILLAAYPDFRVAVLEPDARPPRFRREGMMMEMPAPPPMPPKPPSDRDRAMPVADTIGF